MIHYKSYALVGIFTALMTMHLQAHAFLWSDWREPIEGAGLTDMPFVHGKPTKDKYRGRSCAFCTTGAKGEGALFSTDGRERNYGEIEELQKKIITKSEKLLQEAIPKSEWIYLKKTFVGTDRYFYPIRIFVPSIDPLIIITAPWSYKVAMNKNFDGHGLIEEVGVFYEWEYSTINKERRVKTKMMGFGDELFIPYEIRSSLPKEISQIKIISKGFQQGAILPMQPGDQTLTVNVNDQKINFSRSANGKTIISFD